MSFLKYKTNTDGKSDVAVNNNEDASLHTGKEFESLYSSIV